MKEEILKIEKQIEYIKEKKYELEDELKDLEEELEELYEEDEKEPDCDYWPGIPSDMEENYDNI